MDSLRQYATELPLSDTKLRRLDVPYPRRNGKTEPLTRYTPGINSRWKVSSAERSLVRIRMSPEIEAAWALEIERRLDELHSGLV